jgi:NAD(P)-dependent dehydrogenase (short-subunit alcohol dehydrogenase family)
MSLSGQTVAITGASGGLGRQLARQAAARGARLSLMARNEPKLRELAGELGDDVLVFVGDVTSADDAKKFICSTVEKFGALDHIIANAGQSMWADFEQIEDTELFRQLMEVNFMGVVNCIHPAIDALKKSRGQAVIVSSIQSKFGVPSHSAYGASKHAIEGLVDSLRFELADSGINFMVVYPHWIRGTGMRENALGPDCEAIGDRKRKHSKSSIPADECACKVLDALPCRRKSLFIPGKLKYLPALRLLLPPVFHWLIRSKIKSQK